MITLIAKDKLGVTKGLMRLLGDVSIDTKLSWLFEREHPFDPSKSYQFGKYYKDRIRLNVVLTAEDSELIRGIFGDDSLDSYIQWSVGKYLYTRKIDIDSLPDMKRIINNQEIVVESTYREAPPAFDVEKETRVSVNTYSYRIRN